MRKSCKQYQEALQEFDRTGKASDDYIEHLAICHKCQNEFQQVALKGIKALPTRPSCRPKQVFHK